VGDIGNLTLPFHNGSLFDALTFLSTFRSGPRRELQKVTPRDFDAFFAQGIGPKKDSRNSCGAVPRKGGPLLQFTASAGRWLLCMSQSSGKTS